VRLISRILTISMVAIAQLYSATAYAEQIKQHCFDSVGCWSFVRFGKYIDVFFTADSTCPVSSGVVVSLAGEDHRFRIVSNEPGEHHAGQFPFPTQSVVTWKFMLFAGTNEAEHDDTVVYELPFDAGTASRVTQAYDGPTTHQGEHHYAIDFSMSTGTPVHVARAGEVALIVDAPCDDPAGTGCRNVRVDIRHPDGTYATYQHLKPDSIAVAVLEQVEAGQLLARSGNSGKSAGPHLHFQVYAPTPRGKQIVDSVATMFSTGDGETTLKSSSTYSRPVNSATSDVASGLQR
ncbi:MAG: M23 family metallopeptidase, partial [Woeseiaceae bacterium]